MFTVYAFNGGTRHISELQPAQIFRVTELNYVSRVICILAFSTGKISVALLIYRLQAPSWWRTRVLVFLTTSSLVIAILVIALFFAQCSPTNAVWLPHMGTCWNRNGMNDWDIAASSMEKWCHGCMDRAENLSRLLGSGRLPPRYSTYDVPLEISTGTEEKSAVLYAPWTGNFVSTAVCNLEPSSDAFYFSASICAAVKASYLPALTAEADITIADLLNVATRITVSLLIWNM